MSKKKLYNKTSNYGIFMSANTSENSDSYIGKVRSNFLGTEFLIFDNGYNQSQALNV